MAVQRDMQVLPEFISEQEETSLLAELEPVLKKMRYEFDHWDNAIHGFRETERSAWWPQNEAVLARVRARALPPGGAGGAPLPYAHVLDLAPAGRIKPHVDAVRFCGEVIAGLCLSSAAVMRLRHERDARLVLDALLPRRCLYVMRGTARYEFSHAVLGNEESFFRGARVLKLRRVAVLCRSQPRPQDAQH
ncbi:alpha-ketoglutarate-dependent dioxygenase alkB homolog 7, mitochondrial [Hyposmocoma kahamanoa]|uniref:alpha-ketoglutarate-dependent dioxygenase alkB homolog 7, mitochondrial n=1 Tax=Hyposmocoma kahamanoa TaxID=1477025 RepID=UPI000E6D73F7|nr:alpha-ketoglutarate-dependent dioxygenase alkB homolog 7, mitochondrial [Hyposmocoma kahamanoa]